MLKIAGDTATAIVALLHLAFLVVEMFYWDKPLGLRAFGLTPELAKASKILAANQGLYNGFLTAGLIWGLIQGGPQGRAVKIFFLACVIAAGVFGAATANRNILWIQALPSAVALALILAS